MEAIFYPNVIRHKLGLNIPEIWYFPQQSVILWSKIHKEKTDDEKDGYNDSDGACGHNGWSAGPGTLQTFLLSGVINSLFLRLMG